VFTLLNPSASRRLIGKSLEADVEVSGDAATIAVLQRYAAELPMILIVSDVTLSTASSSLRVQVTPARQRRCARCWRCVVGGTSGSVLCARCVGVVEHKQ
jgi:isoleucyl-tRNA synthetase